MDTYRGMMIYWLLVAVCVGSLTFVWAVREGPIHRAAWTSECSMFYPDGKWVVINYLCQEAP